VPIAFALKDLTAADETKLERSSRKASEMRTEP